MSPILRGMTRLSPFNEVVIRVEVDIAAVCESKTFKIQNSKGRHIGKCE